MDIRSNLYGESLFVTLLATPQKELLFVNEQWSKLVCELKHYNLFSDLENDKKNLSAQIASELNSQNFHRVRLNYQLLAPAWPLLKKTNDIKWKANAYITPIEFSLAKLPTKTAKTFVKATDVRISFHCKVGSLGHESLYFLKQQNSEWDDYLWINPDQTIRECATSNVFAVLKNGEWVTPDAKNCYSGVTRNALLSWLPKQGIKVTIADISLNNLSQVNYLVFTNAIQLLGILNLAGHNFAQPEWEKELLPLRQKFFLDMQLQTGGNLGI